MDRKGISQGGLTSPYLFNQVYKDLIKILNSALVALENTNYNVICCANDIILCSITTSGLQSLTDKALSYVCSQVSNLIQVKVYA